MKIRREGDYLYHHKLLGEKRGLTEVLGVQESKTRLMATYTTPAASASAADPRRRQPAPPPPCPPDVKQRVAATTTTRHSAQDWTPYLFNIARINSQCALKKRLETFQNWSLKVQDPTDLAEAGLWYPGLNDTAVCFLSNCTLKSWSPGDKPWVVHAMGCPSCPFVQMAAPTIVQRIVYWNYPQNLSDPSYFQVRMRTLANISVHTFEKTDLAAAGFMWKNGKIVCFACNVSFVGEFTGNTVPSALSIHAKLNNQCDFLKMIVPL